MDERKGLKNIFVSIFFRVAIFAGAIIVRRFLIQYIGNEANGLSSLYLSVIGFLSVAELGVGDAITFCMYKPIVEGKKNTVAALYRLFKKIYYIVGAVIMAAGLVTMFFLPKLAKDYVDLDINLYRTFFLTLVSVVLTYMFSAKTSLLNAHKYNYISTTITSCGTLLEDGLKIAAIIITKSFEAYIICRIITVLLQWIIVDVVVKKKFPDIIDIRATIDDDNKKKLINNIKAMFMHRIGNVLVNTIDSVVISAFIGVIVLGKFSNYTSIMGAMITVLTLFFYPLSSVVGHALVSMAEEQSRKYYYFFYGLNYALGVVACLGYYAVIDDMITVFYGANLILEDEIAIVITVDYFIQFMRTSTMMFRNSSGVFYYDRWKPLFEGVSNVVFSILLVKKIGVVGVIVATIFTNLLICDIIEPFVVFKHCLNTSPKRFYISNYLYIALFTATLFGMKELLVSNSNVWADLLLNGCIAVAVSIVPIGIMILTNKEFREIGKNYLAKIKRKLFARGTT